MASISQRSNGTWRAKVRKAGFSEQSRTFKTEHEAQVWARALEEQIDSGRPLNNEDADTTPIRELVQFYQESAQHTPEVEAQLIQLKLGPFADTMASDLSSSDIQEWQPERNELTDLFEAVIEKARADFGIRLPDNPVRAAYAKPQTMRVRRLAPYEEEQLLEEANRTRAGYLADAIILDLETALNLSELVNLDWADVFLDRSEIVVRTRKGDRIIPLTDKAKSVLASRGCEMKGQVFAGLSTQALQRSFIRATERANISDLHFNDLRHEAIFRMKERHTLEEIWRISGVQMPSLKRYYGNPNTQ